MAITKHQKLLDQLAELKNQLPDTRGFAQRLAEALKTQESAATVGEMSQAERDITACRSLLQNARASEQRIQNKIENVRDDIRHLLQQVTFFDEQIAQKQHYIDGDPFTAERRRMHREWENLEARETSWRKGFAELREHRAALLADGLYPQWPNLPPE